MIISTTDPVTLHEIPNPDQHPYVIEGYGVNALKIYFESEESRSIYLTPKLPTVIQSPTPQSSNVMPFHKTKH